MVIIYCLKLLEIELKAHLCLKIVQASLSQKTYKFQATSWASREIRFQNGGQSTYQAMEIQG